jgi:hypothetical protein
MVLEQLLKAIRQSEPTDKVVLVSNYTQALDVLGRMCAAQKWETLRLDGSCSVKQRQGLVDRFNDANDKSFCFLARARALNCVAAQRWTATGAVLAPAHPRPHKYAAAPPTHPQLSSKAGGVGLNIIGANRLVLFDSDWCGGGGALGRSDACGLQAVRRAPLCSRARASVPTPPRVRGAAPAGTPPTTCRRWRACGARASASACGSTASSRRARSRRRRAGARA